MDRTYRSVIGRGIFPYVREFMSTELREAFNRLEDSDSDAISEYLAEHSKKKLQEFYREDQARDYHGRFEDEGKSGQVSHEKESEGNVSERSYVVDADTRGSFRSAIQAAAKAHKFGAAVEVKPEAFYQDEGNTLYLSRDKQAGAVVTKDGDLVSVFKNPNSKEDIMPLLKEAAAHATTLDCFDTGDGYLPNLYAKLGFKPVAKVEFNPEHAPKGWNYETMDNPNVVFMSKQGIDIAGGYSEAKDSIPTVSYEKAVALQAGRGQDSGLGVHNTKGYLGETDSQVFYTDGKNVYRANKSNVTDVRSGYPIGRWEASLEHWKRYRKSVYDYVKDKS